MAKGVVSTGDRGGRWRWQWWGSCRQVWCFKCLLLVTVCTLQLSGVERVAVAGCQSPTAAGRRDPGHARLRPSTWLFVPCLAGCPLLAMVERGTAAQQAMDICIQQSNSNAPAHFARVPKTGSCSRYYYQDVKTSSRCLRCLIDSARRQAALRRVSALRHGR